MSGVSSLGIGSGLDLSGLLTSLMSAEQQPLVALQKREASYQARLSSLGTLKSSLTSLQTAAKALAPSGTQTAVDKFAKLSTSVGDSSLLSASVGTTAVAGSYTLSNIALAQKEQIRKDATALAVPTTTDGTLSIKVGSAAAVNVDVSAGKSLSDIASAINQAGAGVSASVVNDGSVDHLMLTAENSGQSNQITITASADDASTAWDGFNYTPPGVGGAVPYTNNAWTEQQAAKSANVTVNGIAVTSDTNSISSAITGVTLTLSKESATGTTLNIAKDTSSNISSALNSFIKAYNDTVTTMSNLGYYDASSTKAGALQGDSALRNSQSQVRSLLFATTDTGDSKIRMLSDIGVSVAKDGTLSLDSLKMNKAINSNYTAVAKLVADAGNRYSTGLGNLVGTTGTLSAATDSTSRMIAVVQTKQTELSEHLVTVRARYVKQFTSLDTLISKMNTTSSYLTQQLANLPGSSSSNN